MDAWKSRLIALRGFGWHFLLQTIAKQLEKLNKVKKIFGKCLIWIWNWWNFDNHKKKKIELNGRMNRGFCAEISTKLGYLNRITDCQIACAFDVWNQEPRTMKGTVKWERNERGHVWTRISLLKITLFVSFSFSHNLFRIIRSWGNISTHKRTEEHILTRTIIPWFVSCCVDWL